MADFDLEIFDPNDIMSIGVVLDNAIDGVFLASYDIAREYGERVVEEARDMFGTYQPGWPSLTENTLKRRERRGENPNDEPLLEYGDMKERVMADEPELESGRIGHAAVYSIRVGYRANVSGRRGDSSPYEITHELGSSRVPARPVLITAALRASSYLRGIMERAYEFRIWHQTQARSQPRDVRGRFTRRT